MKYPINIKAIIMNGNKPAVTFTFFCFTIRYAKTGTTVNADKVINAEEEMHERAENKNISIVEIIWLN
jgi:hypothetical protein